MTNILKIESGTHFSQVYILGPGQNSEVPEKITLEADSSVNIVIIILPGVSCYLPITVDLKGRGADANISGVYLCGSDEHVKIDVELTHKVPDCTSHQLFKGIAAGSSHFDFYGKIIVVQDAQKTEAYQENHNILLTETAKVDTKPQLEIYADDVKCTHGATIGRLNEDEQFYMRSRGISEADALVLQMISFTAPVFDHIEDNAQREEMRTLYEDAIRSLTAK